MPSNVAIRVRSSSATLRDDLVVGLAAIADELDLPSGFPPDVTAAAEKAAAGPTASDARRDATDLEFITIDPDGSMDLDQAMHLARLDSAAGSGAAGYVVHYAIADVAAFVRAGDPIDVEARLRGETLYGAGDRIPLHPPELSEGAASLLPDQVRPALLWTIHLDAAGTRTGVAVERAMVRSRRRWSYTEAQAALAGDEVPEALTLLREIGLLLEKQEVDRGGVSLPLPEQEIEEVDEGAEGTPRFDLTFREVLPLEGWNAQISLLTGMAAAQIMLEGGIGLLRTLPPADPRDVKRLRRVARGLRIDWPADAGYPAFVHSLDPSVPAHQAMTVACTRLLRGSGYAAFDGAPPEQPLHAAIAASYAHVTAPLRRLGDRFASEICIALQAGETVPDWVRSALPELPDILRSSAQRAGAYERAVVDLIETVLLADRVGEEFEAVVTQADDEPRDGEHRGTVLVRDVGVEAKVLSSEPLPLGEETKVRLETADVATRTVRFRR